MTAITPLGRVLRDPDGLRLEFVRTYDAPVDDVWAALTDSDRTARWIGPWSGDPATGSVALTMSAEAEGDPSPVQILRCVPPTELVVETAGPAGPGRLAVTLRAIDAGTELTFVQRFEEPFDTGSI